MQLRNAALIAALAGVSPAGWAATSNVDVYGVTSHGVDVVSSAASGVHASAAFVPRNAFSYQGTPPQIAETTTPGQAAAVLGDGYTAVGRADYGRNRTFARYDHNAAGNGLQTAAGAAWYEQLTISGGSGTGTASFSVRLRGVVDAGHTIGAMGYRLSASALNPYAHEPASGPTFNVLQPPAGWRLNDSQTTRIAEYTLASSPYNDTSRIAGLFGPGPSAPPASPYAGGQLDGIPSISAQQPGNSSGSSQPGFEPDLILAPGAGQLVDLVLTGTFTFTYGEAFYLIGEMSTAVLDGLGSFKVFDISDQPQAANTPDTDLVTQLDFSQGAFLSGIVLPIGANAVFASGTPYTVAAAVPEPGEWALFAAGLALVGWRVRRRG